MKKLIISIVFLLLTSIGNSLAADRAPNWVIFLGRYGEVYNELKSTQGNLKEYSEILSADQQTADKIAGFWIKKVEIEYKDPLISCKEKYAKMLPQNFTQADVKRVGELYAEEYYSYFNTYFYDHWDEINKMIIDKHIELTTAKKIPKT
ncbi:hypothetical protein [Cloacibacillus evryensis]|uniref:DUF2059 domain-containing protein n=1 Tax=Cloacibacillus evryensis TaxID=508460 RepID=A0AAW5K365_9BACT|nr:hypothetical protein [Cloacibacillus evryensis]MCQ4813544.1 hypothetical protein [Cloacibacillus evryensis]